MSPGCRNCCIYITGTRLRLVKRVKVKWRWYKHVAKSLNLVAWLGNCHITTVLCKPSASDQSNIVSDESLLTWMHIAQSTTKNVKDRFRYARLNALSWLYAIYTGFCERQMVPTVYTIIKPMKYIIAPTNCIPTWLTRRLKQSLHNLCCHAETL